MLKINQNLPLPTKEFILENLSDQQIFEYYIPGYKIGDGNICSPLRDNDKDPSFSIFYSQRLNMLLFKDFGGLKGDCIVFVSKLYNISYFEALCRISQDFGLKGVSLPLGYKAKKIQIKKKVANYSKIIDKVNIQVKTKEFTTEELSWWLAHGISYKYLKKYNIFSLQKVFIGDWIFTNPFMFGYLEYYNNEYYWSIYQPFNKDYKFIKNVPATCIQGWSNLPLEGEVLILEKAYKDFIPIVEHTEYASCGLQNEGVIIKPKVMEDLHKRFKRIYFCGDNDDPGLKFSKKICKENDLIPIFIPCNKYKNFSDLIYGIKSIDYSVKILNKLIKNNV